MKRKTSFLVIFLIVIMLIMPLWPSYVGLKFGHLPGIDLIRVLILLTGIMWLAVLSSHAATRKRLVAVTSTYWKLIWLVIVPFFLWKIITAFLSGGGVAVIYSAFRDVGYQLVIFLIAISVLRDLQYLRYVVTGWVMVALIISVLACIESVIERNLFTTFVPSDVAATVNKSNVEFATDDIYRALGTFSNSLSLASFSVFVLPFAYWLAGCWKGWKRILGFIAVPMLVLALQLTHSRAGLGALVFMVGGHAVTVIYKYYKKSRGYLKVAFSSVGLGVVVLITTGVFFVGEQLILGATERDTRSSGIRLLQLTIGVPAVLSSPLVGYGPGNAAKIIGLSERTVDNYYLSLALESGLPELILFIVLLVAALAMAWNGQRKLPSPWRQLSSAIFWAIAASALFLAVLSLEQTIPLLFMAIAMVIVLQFNQPSQVGYLWINDCGKEYRVFRRKRTRGPATGLR